MNGHATTVLDERPVASELVEAWVAFIAAMEERYASLARRDGQPFTRHTPDELFAVAELAASLELPPPVVGAELACATACAGTGVVGRPTSQGPRVRVLTAYGY